MPSLSEKRTEDIAKELLEVRGWNIARPPKGNVLWKNEYREYEFLRDAFSSRSKTGTGAGYPDFVVVDHATKSPLIVVETKSSGKQIGDASSEASYYADALVTRGYHPLAVGIAGNTASEIAVTVSKQTDKGKWTPIEYRGTPIQWLPTPQEASVLISDTQLFDLQPRVPSEEALAIRADEINRIFRECDIKDEFRPAVIGAFMLGLAQTHGNVRIDPDHVLQDINNACHAAFQKAGKLEIADSIRIPEANDKLAARAVEIIYILRLLNLTTLTAAHDYLGQLYETFFRFTGGNTIGQFFTPRHITKFVTDLCQISDADYVIDPTCGTGGFLISTLYRMIDDRSYTQDQISKLVADHLKGFESEPITAALCVANMILRGDGTTGIVKGDCFTDVRFPLKWATVVLGNPPFPHRKTDVTPDKFVDRALETLQTRGRLAMIVPESFLVKAQYQAWRDKVLKKNRLDAVISLPSELFQPYASPNTSIIVLERGVKHDPSRPTFFCKIENDGLKLRKNVRMPRAGEQLTTALHSYRSRVSQAQFCDWVSLTGGEWAPGAYIQGVKHTIADIQRIADSLVRSRVSLYTLYANHIVRFNELLQLEEYQPVAYERQPQRKTSVVHSPDTIGDLFNIYYGQQELENKTGLQTGNMPLISSAGSDNGCYGFFDFLGIAPLIAPPFVTVPRTGSIGEAFVQTTPCGVTSDCILLIPKEGTDIEDLYLAASVVRQHKWRFNYGRKITPSRLAQIKLSRDANLKAWIKERHLQSEQVVRLALTALATNDLHKEFSELTEEWESDTQLLSNIIEKSMHPSYQRIIALGKPVVHLLLKDFQEERFRDWFWALKAITGANPIPDDMAGNITAMAEEWVKWGKANNYLIGSVLESRQNFQTSLNLDTM